MINSDSENLPMDLMPLRIVSPTATRMHTWGGAKLLCPPQAAFLPNRLRQRHLHLECRAAVTKSSPVSLQHLVTLVENYLIDIFLTLI